jgi:hypothetical protein
MMLDRNGCYNNPNLPTHEDIIPILVSFIQKNSKL